MSFEEFLAALTREELELINQEFEKRTQKIPTYTFSSITDKDLNSLFDIERVFNHSIFKEWFDKDIALDEKTHTFLTSILDREGFLIKIYNEEDLKVHFIAPILNHVNFLSLDKRIRDFYEEKISYQGSHFILTGNPDFLVAKGVKYPEKPYFFIQEFKKELTYLNPETQLLAELIAALELNKFTHIKGAYIVGAIWNFVIVNKTGDNQYQYYISENFDSTKIDDLKLIYKNLLFVKQEIMQDSELGFIG